MTITVSSSTETQEALQEAADYGLKTARTATAEPPEVENAEPSEAQQAETGADSETARAGESEEEPEEEEEEEGEDASARQPMGKTRRKLLRQISRLTGRNVTLQEQLESAEERLRRLEEGAKPGAKPAAETAPAGKPSPKDYKDYEDYVEALADWKIQQRDLERAQSAQNEYLKQVFEDYNQQVESAREIHEDFDEVVGSSAQVPILAINAMYECENGAEVAYYLGQHPEVRAQLLEWNQPGFKGGIRKILAKIDTISEQLPTPKARSSSTSSPSSTTARARPRPATSAPAPIRPVGATSSSRSTADPGEMSFQDYKRWHAKKYPDSR